METTTTTMSTLLDTVSSVSTWIFGQIGNVCEAIVSNPILIATVGFLFVGGVIGIVSRLLRR